MATTTCPHCRREIRFELEQISPVFECAACGGRFTPVGEPVVDSSPVEEKLPHSDFSSYEPRRPNATRNVVIAFSMLAMIVFAVIIGVIIASSDESNSP